MAVLCACLLGSVTVHAAESDSGAETEEKAATETKPKDEARSKATDVFVPTEEISEDASVPFPVDI